MNATHNGNVGMNNSRPANVQELLRESRLKHHSAVADDDEMMRRAIVQIDILHERVRVQDEIEYYKQQEIRDVRQKKEELKTCLRVLIGRAQDVLKE